MRIKIRKPITYTWYMDKPKIKYKDEVIECEILSIEELTENELSELQKLYRKKKQ